MLLFLTFPPTPPPRSAVPGAYLGVGGYRLPRQPHRETLCRCQGNLLLRLLTLSSPSPGEIQFERARTSLKEGRKGAGFCGARRKGRRSPNVEEGKKMVRFLVIIFDGASEDVPNEDLTLIKDEFSLPLLDLFLSLALVFLSYQR